MPVLIGLIEVLQEILTSSFLYPVMVKFLCNNLFEVEIHFLYIQQDPSWWKVLAHLLSSDCLLLSSTLSNTVLYICPWGYRNPFIHDNLKLFWFLKWIIYRIHINQFGLFLQMQSSLIMHKHKVRNRPKLSCIHYTFWALCIGFSYML